MKGQRPELKAVDGGLLNAPPMPATLASEMAQEWQEVSSDLTGRGLLPQSSIAVLEVYFTALWMSRLCSKAIAKHGVVVMNKDGVLRPNPAGGMMTRSNDTVARLAYELGISAAGRNLPVVKTQVKVADDSADPLSEFDV